jgi:C_GCAxxG_C_C family probable redox protein
MTRSQKAVELFNSGFACSQAVLVAYANEFGISEQLAYKLASPFRGGIARTGATCGAVIGAIMVIGLHSGITDPNDIDGRIRNTSLAKEFLDKFQQQHLSTDCSGLLSFDRNDPEGLNKASAQGLTKQLCPIYVKSASDILDSMLFSE